MCNDDCIAGFLFEHSPSVFSSLSQILCPDAAPMRLDVQEIVHKEPAAYAQCA